MRGRWSRLVVGLAAVGLLARCGAPSDEGARAEAGEVRQAAVSTLTFAPVADAAVQGAYPTQNFGSGAWLLADTSPTEEGYLRFSVSGVSGTVTSAKLRLYASDGTSNGPALYPVAGGWSESGITWNTKPARTGAAVANLGAVSAGTFVEYDVTALVKGDGTYDLGLIPEASDGSDFGARENPDTSRRPHLVLTVDSGETPPPPPPPGDGQVHTLTPYQDATAASATPDTSACCRAYLSADTSPLEESYLGFDLRSLSGTVASAKLRLYVTDATSDGPRVHRVTGTWSASTLTWNTRPAYEGTPLANTGALSASTWVEYDVTGAVRAGETFSVALVADSSNGADFASMESADAALRPQLVVTLGTSEPPPPPPPDDCLARTDTFSLDEYLLADLDVSQDAPTTSYATAPVLRSDASPRYEAFLRFSVDADPSAEGAPIRSAKLRLYVLDPTSNAPAVYLAMGWADGTITWNNRPQPTGSALANLGEVVAGTWVEYDVTSAVRTDGTYAFALMPESSNGVDFASQEYRDANGWGGYGPQLVVTRETPSYCSYRGAGGGVTRAARQHGAGSHEEVSATAAHPQGGAVVVGRTAENGTFGGATFGAGGMVLARYAADGTHVWSRLAAQGDVQPRGVVVTPEGNALVMGTYNGAPDFGAGLLPMARRGMFVAKFAPDGRHVWSRGFVSTYVREEPMEWPIEPASIATDAQGSLIVGGAFYGQMDLGGGPLYAGSASMAFDDAEPGGFVARFSWDGQHVWSRAFEGGYGANDAEVQDVATDAAGNVYVAGDGGSNTDLGDGVKGGFNNFLARYSPEGALVWKRTFQSFGTIAQVQPLAGGQVLFVGRFGETFTFGGQTYQASDYYGDLRPYLGALDASGNDLWIQREERREPAHLFALGDGGWLVTGEVHAASDLGGGVLGSTTLAAAYGRYANLPYAARYRADRSHVWSRTFDNALGYGAWAGRLAASAAGDGSLVLGANLVEPITLDGSELTSRGRNDVLMLFLAP